MASSKLTVVICQAQGRNPVKRQLEEELLSALIAEPDVDATLLPHLYDMSQNHSGMAFLRSIPGNVLVLGWLYERALRWTLDRAGLRGHEGEVQLKNDDEDDDSVEDPQDQSRGIGGVDLPDRNIYCVDLRSSGDVDDYLLEVRRIVQTHSDQPFDLMSFIQGAPEAEQLERYLNPEKQLEARRSLDEGSVSVADRQALPEDTRRRWYPVIDYSRCTNCMECIDFCLFGVYGVDALDRILVEEQDNCKKGVRPVAEFVRKMPSFFLSTKRPQSPEQMGKFQGSRSICRNSSAEKTGHQPLIWRSLNAIVNWCWTDEKLSGSRSASNNEIEMISMC